MNRNPFIVVMLAAGLPLLSLALTNRDVIDVHADEPSAVWKFTRTLSAPEAHQAAAADERFVYAIASEQVAKYDRKTSEQVAISSGAAQHLNSGFFLDGQLYLAHSNYPRTPEQSEIRRLDPEKMQIEIFHDFGNFGGSLTWAIQREGHWWCNFAHYGTVNDQTFLVRFEPAEKIWKEHGRWTYPAQVLKQIGQASISGGVWDGDTLLVTDHDHEVLYRLKIPQQGTVLEFVGQETAPFTGQGIAVDPVTRGLVGIDRGKKQILFAERQETSR